MRDYLSLLEKTVKYGKDIETRNGVRRTIYGAQMHIPLEETFPLVTTRYIPWKNPTTEVCWFLRGDTDTEFLHEHNVHIWDANANSVGFVGKIYGYQWRYGFHVDQVERAVKMLKKNPRSTRNIVTAWNPVDMDEMALPPCHQHFQLHSDGKNLTLQFSMRSTDLILGLPTNIAGYAILAHLFAHVSGQKAVELIVDLGNAHIYESHIEGANVQLQREPLAQPKMRIAGIVPEDLKVLHPSQFRLEGYVYHPAIKFNMVV